MLPTFDFGHSTLCRWALNTPGALQLGDRVTGVAGAALSHPTDKLSEATDLLSRASRPVRVVFESAQTGNETMPSEIPSTLGAAGGPGDEEGRQGDAATAGASGGTATILSPGSPPTMPEQAFPRTYEVSFEGARLGLTLLDQGAGQPPVVGSSEHLSSAPQGELRLPLPGHRLVAVNDLGVMHAAGAEAALEAKNGSTGRGSGGSPYATAVALVKAVGRPARLRFEAPARYELVFPGQRLGLSVQEAFGAAAHTGDGLPSVQKAGCALTPWLRRASRSSSTCTWRCSTP